MDYSYNSKYKEFQFTSFSYDENNRTINLNYSFDNDLSFTEQITFVNAPLLQEEKRNLFNECMRLLHIAAGISYYKAFIPKSMNVMTKPLSKEEADFFQLFYESGLGEFSYRNNVIPEINFKSENVSREILKEKLSWNKRVVVPVGGGKDSIVTMETLNDAGYKPTLFAVGRPRPIKETIELSGLDSIEVKRKISPKLIEINGTEGVLNGHVPITGIIAFILLCSAVLYNFTDVAMSNERSANVGNTFLNGKMVNHQWSKSIEFEKNFQKITKPIFPEFNYFSFLRPLSEIMIAQRFARKTKYDSVFTSCNHAFRLDETKRISYWCGNCDKCRFVLLALSAFMSKERLMNIFKFNPLNDESQIEGFRQLLGLSAFKPFECVGEIKESVWAFLQLIKNKDYNGDIVVETLKEEVLSKYSLNEEEIRNNIFSINEDTLIPRSFEDAVRRIKE
ncbi:MAG: hypothetical protein MJ247_02470 [Alphaproteobacteria bacterium]|nr:hypothetical protein [Alphaproteobacteria bacterium]